MLGNVFVMWSTWKTQEKGSMASTVRVLVQFFLSFFVGLLTLESTIWYRTKLWIVTRCLPRQQHRGSGHFHGEGTTHYYAKDPIAQSTTKDETRRTEVSGHFRLENKCSSSYNPVPNPLWLTDPFQGFHSSSMALLRFRARWLQQQTD